MTKEEWLEKLKAEGFGDIRIQEFRPDMEFPEHRHEKLTAHVMLAGELTTTDPTGSRTVKPGDRFDVSAGTTHNAKCGPEGCTFIVGEK